MTESRERQFLHAKQRLDELRLPAIFPIECTQLITRLLSMTSISSTDNSRKHEQPNYHKVDSESKVKAMSAQLQRTVKENNHLHLENIHLKEDNEMLQKKILLLEGIKINPKEQAELNKMNRDSEKELERKLAKLTKKHNDLLIKVYGEEQGLENLDKDYVKNGQEQQLNQAIPPRRVTSKQEKHHVHIENEPMHANFADTKKNQELHDTIDSLKSKVKAREAEISRLQHKMDYDGLNINKLIKDNQDREAFTQKESLNYQVDLLNKENFKLKEELRKVRAASGRAQVLRVQNQKLRSRLQKQQKQSTDNKATLQKNQHHSKSAVIKLRNEIGNKQVEKFQVQKTLEKLQSENQELAKTIKSLEKELDQQVYTNDNLQEKIQSLQEQIGTLKNAQEGEKMYLNYELEDFKKKHLETQKYGRDHASKASQLTSKLNQLTETNRLNQQEIALKTESICNLQEIRRQQQRIIERYSLKVSQLQSPLHKQLEYTSNHLHQMVQSNKQLQLDFNKIKVENEVLRRKIDQVDEESEHMQDQEHHKITMEINKLLKINQDLRSQLERSNGNVQSVQSSMIEVDRLKHQLRKQSQALSLSHTKVETLELQNQELTKNLIAGQEKSFKLKEENKRLRTQLTLLGQKANFLEEEHALLFEYKKVQIPRVGRMEDDILVLTNEIKQGNVTNTLISEENSRLKKDLFKLQTANRQLRLMSSQPTHDLMLRNQLNSLVGKHQTLILVNKNLKEALGHLKNENEEMSIDRGNFVKEANHLRLQVHELQQRNLHYKQSQESLRKTLRELQASRSDIKHHPSQRQSLDLDISTEQLKSKIEKAQQQYNEAMRDSEEMIIRSQH